MSAFSVLVGLMHEQRSGLFWDELGVALCSSKHAVKAFNDNPQKVSLLDTPMKRLEWCGSDVLVLKPVDHVEFQCHQVGVEERRRLQVSPGGT
jgi:hypothetical protein